MSLLVELIYGLVGRVEDNARTGANGRDSLVLTAERCLPCCFWQTAAQGRRIRSGGVKLDDGSAAGSANKLLRGAAVLAGVSALEIRYVVVVLRDAVDETRLLSKTQPFEG